MCKIWKLRQGKNTFPHKANKARKKRCDSTKQGIVL